MKLIARQLGCSHRPVKDYVVARGVKPLKSPERPKRLDQPCELATREAHSASS